MSKQVIDELYKFGTGCLELGHRQNYKLSKKFITNFIEKFQNVKLDLFQHRLMVRHEENMTTQKKMDDI